MKSGEWREVSRAPALQYVPFEDKRPIVNRDEPRMNTNRHEYTWTSFNHKMHKIHKLCFCAFCGQFRETSGCRIFQKDQFINPIIGVHSCPFVVRRFSEWMCVFPRLLDLSVASQAHRS